MKYLLILVFTNIQIFCQGQISKDSIYYGLLNQDQMELKFTLTDLDIIRRADEILSDESKWSKSDDRICEDDISSEKFSLFCALYKASVDIAGSYEHRRAAMQIVRFVIEKYGNERVLEHRLMDWNNHQDTKFSEVKQVLATSVEIVEKELVAKK